MRTSARRTRYDNRRVLLLSAVLFCLALALVAAPGTSRAETSGVWTYALHGTEATITDCAALGEPRVTVPDALDGHPVTAIAEGAFADCAALEEATLPPSILSVADGAFAGHTPRILARNGSEAARFAKRAGLPWTSLSMEGLSEHVVDLADLNLSAQGGALFIAYPANGRARVGDTVLLDRGYRVTAQTREAGGTRFSLTPVAATEYLERIVVNARGITTPIALGETVRAKSITSGGVPYASRAAHTSSHTFDIELEIGNVTLSFPLTFSINADMAFDYSLKERKLNECFVKADMTIQGEIGSGVNIGVDNKEFSGLQRLQVQLPRVALYSVGISSIGVQPYLSLEIEAGFVIKYELVCTGSAVWDPVAEELAVTGSTGADASCELYGSITVWYNFGLYLEVIGLGDVVELTLALGIRGQASRDINKPKCLDIQLDIVGKFEASAQILSWLKATRTFIAPEYPLGSLHIERDSKDDPYIIWECTYEQSTVAPSTTPAPVWYTLTFDTDGGSPIADMRVLDGSPASDPGTPVKPGYVFVEWRSGDSESAVWRPENPVFWDMQLIAIWREEPDASGSASWTNNCEYSYSVFRRDDYYCMIDRITSSSSVTNIVLPETLACQWYEPLLDEYGYHVYDKEGNERYVSHSAVLPVVYYGEIDYINETYGYESVNSVTFHMDAEGCRDVILRCDPRHIRYIGSKEYSVSMCSELASNSPNLVSLVFDGAVTQVHITMESYDNLRSVVINNTCPTNVRLQSLPSLAEVRMSGQVTDLDITYCDELASLSIPANSTVKSINNNNKLKTVTFGGAARYVGDTYYGGCFENDYALERITLPAGFFTGEDTLDAFYNCVNLRDCALPGGMTTLGSFAFSDCVSLTNVTLPASLNAIQSLAFNNCSALAAIELPASVESIDDYAFDNCSGLTHIELPTGLKTIGRYAFSDCDSLLEIELPNSVVTLDEGVFYKCSSLVSAKLPAGLETIANDTFIYCRALEEITLPEGLKSIGNSAFYDCGSLLKISLPEGLKSIGNSAFYDCGSLLEISLPEGLESIGEQAFHACASLTAVAFPESLKNVGVEAFSYCDSLKDITLPETAVEYGKYCFDHCVQLERVAIPDAMTIIPERMFYDCASLTEVSMPDGLLEIEESAFYGCKRLYKLVFPLTLTRIGSSAFCYCASLSEVWLPESLVSIEDYAFGDCFSMRDIVFNGAQTVIDNSAFGDYSLEEVTIHGYADSTAQAFAETHSATFKQLGSEFQIVIVDIGERQGTPQYVDWDAPGAALRDPARPGYIFAGWYLDAALTLPWDMRFPVPDRLYARWIECDDENFRYKLAGDGLIAVRYLGEDADATIPEEAAGYPVIGVAYGCFEYTPVERVTVPDSVASIEPGAFLGAFALQDVRFSQSDGGYYNDDGLLLCDGGATLLYSIPHARTETMTLPESITVIENHAFWGESALRALTLPGGLESAPIKAMHDNGIKLYCPEFSDFLQECAALGLANFNEYTIRYYNGDTLWYECVSHIQNKHGADSIGNLAHPLEEPTEENVITIWYWDAACTDPVSIRDYITLTQDVDLYAGLARQHEYEALPDGGVKITRCNGYHDIESVPETLEGHAVRGIATGAYTESQVYFVDINDHIEFIEPNAFASQCRLSGTVGGVAEAYAAQYGHEFEPFVYEVEMMDDQTGELFDVLHHVVPGTELILPTPPDREGVVFAGWFTYVGGMECPAPTIMPDHSIYLHMKWYSNKEGFQKIDAYECEVYSDSVTIVRYAPEGDTPSYVAIPKTFNGKPVTEIADGAFKDREDIYELIFPDSVTTLGTGVLENCWSLHRVVFGDALTALPDDLFSSCEPKFVVFGANIEEITMDSRLCYSNYMVLFAPPDSAMLETLTRIGCNNVVQLTPDGRALITERFLLEYSYYYDCYPNYILDVDCAFLLLEVWPSFEYLDDVRWSTDDASVLDVSALGETNVVSIGDCTLYADVGTLRVATPITTCMMQDGFAFRWVEGSRDAYRIHLFFNTGLEVLDVPNVWNGLPVVEIEDCAMLDIGNTKVLRFGEGLRRIGAINCVVGTALERVEIPASVTEIGEDSFNMSNAAFTIYGSSGSLAEVYAGVIGRPFEVVGQAPSITLPAALARIDAEAFAGSGVSAVTIPPGATEIGARAFANCPTLTRVTIPASVLHIAEDAFQGSPQVTIYAQEGSTAALFAQHAEIPLVVMP